MPVDCGAFFRVCDLVVDSDGERVSPIGLERWARELAINKQDAFVDAIWSDVSALDGEVICSDDACHTISLESAGGGVTDLS